MSARLPAPGQSFIREHAVRIGHAEYRAGMSRPSTTDEGWWLAVMWVAGDGGVVTFREAGPAAGPPPGPPLARLGPAMTAALSGLIAQDGDSLAIRLAPIAPPDDPAQPWRAPLAIRAAFKFEPARAATMTANELADEVLTGFRRAVEGLSRP